MILLELAFVVLEMALIMLLLMWGIYEAFHVAIGGRRRLSSYAALVVMLALLLFFVAASFTPLCDGSVSLWDWSVC